LELRNLKDEYYCGGPVVELRHWVRRSRPTADFLNLWPQCQKRVVVGTFRGRSAITLACRLLGIGPGHEVLAPAYNCGSEIDALLHAGAQVVGYRVSRRGEIDLDDIMARRSSRTRAVYVIHYFGWEQPMASLRQWCDGQHLLLIEDCALALFSHGPLGLLGRTGDAAIFSLPKTLGSYHGGLLSLAASPGGGMPALAPAGFAVLWREIQTSLRGAAAGWLEGLALHSGLLSLRRRLRPRLRQPDAGARLPPMPADYYFNPRKYENRALHPRARAAAGWVSWREIASRRRTNYLWLLRALGEIPGVEPFYPCLPEGVCPLSLPLLVQNRNGCVRDLLCKGIQALPWWAGFHRNGVAWSQFPDACWLKNNMLTLPIHHGLDENHLGYVADTAREVFRTSGAGARNSHS